MYRRLRNKKITKRKVKNKIKMPLGKGRPEREEQE